MSKASSHAYIHPHNASQSHTASGAQGIQESTCTGAVCIPRGRQEELRAEGSSGQCDGSGERCEGRSHHRQRHHRLPRVHRELHALLSFRHGDAGKKL
ncbi:MAG: hypothetical protein NZ522_09485 [Chitinophagales bacterium]|nr:hypothetical protein [Chitinophagales bacterium]